MKNKTLEKQIVAAIDTLATVDVEIQSYERTIKRLNKANKSLEKRNVKLGKMLKASFDHISELKTKIQNTNN